MPGGIIGRLEAALVCRQASDTDEKTGLEKAHDRQKRRKELTGRGGERRS